jgi:hypothetical protein
MEVKKLKKYKFFSYQYEDYDELLKRNYKRI